MIVADTGYDITRLAYVLADLPVELVGRLRSNRVQPGHDDDRRVSQCLGQGPAR